MKFLLRWLMPDDQRRVLSSEEQDLHDARSRRDGARAADRARLADRRSLVFRLLLERLTGGAAADRDPFTPAHRGGRRRGEWLSDSWRDVRQSARSLARTPGLAVTIVLTVGLGLGATTAMVSVIRAVLVSPLPYPNADRLVTVRTLNGDNRFPLSVVDYQAILAQQSSLDAVAASQLISSATVVVNGAADRQTVRIVTSNYLSLLGIAPAAGRLLDPSDEHTGGRSVVLSDEFWRRAFGGDPGAVGRTIAIDGIPHTVVGVLAPSHGPLEHGVAAFQVEDWPTPKRKGPFFLSVIGRLRPGMTRDVAERELAGIDRRLFPIWQSSYQDEKATWTVTDLKERVVGPAGAPLWLVCAGVAGVLLIGCANAANLLVARALDRRQELAVRAALGASRGQLARVLITESALLSFAAAVVAALVAVGAMAAAVRYGSAYIPRIDEVHLSGASAYWLGALGLLSTLAIGAVPALAGSRVSRSAGVDVNRRTMTDGRGSQRVRRTLVAAEFAVATPLIIAAALIVLSLDRLLHVDVGMDGRHVLTASVSLPAGAYPTPAASLAFWDRARAALVSSPGVADVAYSDSRPPVDAANTDNFNLEDRPTPAGENQPVCPWISVSADFFKATGLTLIRGRGFDARDWFATAPPVVVVDRAWAMRFFGAEDVIGRRLHEGGCTTCTWTTVVGVVATVKYLGLDKPDAGTVYWPIADGQRDRFVMVRSSGSAALLTTMVTGRIRELDPNLAISRVATVDDLVMTSTEMPRYLSVLATAFAVSALLLSVVGIYGVMSHHVTRHRRDIGIRLALGGEPARIRLMVVLSGLRVVGVGLGTGVVIAVGAMRLVASLLFDTPTGDIATFAAVPAAMLAAATIACLLPARRAARVEPAVILKDA